MFHSTDWYRKEVKKLQSNAKLYTWTGNYNMYYWIKHIHDFNGGVTSPRKAWKKAYQYLRYI